MKSRTASVFQIRAAAIMLGLLALVVVSSCLPKPLSESGTGGVNITLYGFSIMKEPLEKAIYPAFIAKAKREHNIDIHFTSSFAGSETITNQILQGVKAQVGIFSIERDAQRLQQAGFVTSDWHNLPQRGIVNKTPFVILVRKGNPKGIHDFADLAKPGIKLIHPDPTNSGGAQWSILAMYGSELVKAEKQGGDGDRAKALQTLQAIWRNVISTPASAREARTTFELGNGDALITYELDALLMKQNNAKADAEIVIPEATILSEHPVVVIDRNVGPADRQVIDAFVQYLWTEEAQRAFVKSNFRASISDSLNAENKELATIKYPFTVDYFGGWAKAYPEIIENIFRDQVQKRK
ncbi:MAG TPA: sulfate ABC transporter substrate-binding protein [Pyrinomonadaceae bacterium]|jgi:sulfate/thiosulfate-binding protein|nr:sulfate ABC transporter substrate-binding protein [Pyrinomonadaceae bacterium]